MGDPAYRPYSLGFSSYKSCDTSLDRSRELPQVAGVLDYLQHRRRATSANSKLQTTRATHHCMLSNERFHLHEDEDVEFLVLYSRAVQSLQSTGLLNTPCALRHRGNSLYVMEIPSLSRDARLPVFVDVDITQELSPGAFLLMFVCHPVL